MADENNSAQNTNTGADQTGDQSGNQGNPEYPAELGDAGKRAIDAMKAERNQAKSEFNALKAEFDAFKAQHTTQPGRNDGQEDKQQSSTKTPEQIRDEVMAQVTADTNRRVLRSEVTRLSEGRLSDSGDALRYLDLSDLSPDTHGEYDQAAITSKIDKLLEGRPYLAMAGKPNFQGSADSGNRGDAADKGQLSREDLKHMSPQDINKARTDGRLRDILSGKS